MDTGGQKKVGYSLVKVGDLTLENTYDYPYYRGIVVCRNTIIIIDDIARQVRLHRLQDGKLLYTSHRLESVPRAICVIDGMEICVILYKGEIKIMAVDSRDKMATITSTRNLQVQGGFDRYDGVAKFKENLVVCGVKKDTISWCIVSLNDGHVDEIHNICKDSNDIYASFHHLTTKDNMIYISCCAGLKAPDSGVYGFDILNPSQPKYTYKHKYLDWPGPIAINKEGFIFVCNPYNHGYEPCIHHLTAKCQLVSIYKPQGIPDLLSGICWDQSHGHLYVTCYRSKVIIRYKPEYTGIPIEILNMDDRSIQLFEEALKAGKENVYNIRVMVVGHLGVGKTTLIKRLLGEEVAISERQSTEGVDVYVNCCDVSLSTLNWTRRKKDSEQDYKLQRLVKVLNKNYQSRDKDTVASNTVELLYSRSTQQDIDQNLSSTASHQEESPAIVQRNPTHSETNTMPKSNLGENIASGSHQMDSVREMLSLLQENSAKAIQDVGKFGSLTVYDFAGQYAFYTTHQMFLTRRAIYLLVSDVSGQVNDFVEDECYFDSEGIMKCRVHELVEVWLNSIHSCAPPEKENRNSTHSHTPSYEVTPPPVILVGTHVDKIPKNHRHELGQRYLKEIRSYLKDKPTRFHLVDKDFAIDNTVVDRKLKELKRKIVEVASQQPYWGQEIPTRWLPLEQELMRLKNAGVKVISLVAVENINQKGTVRIEKSEELDLFLRFLHETGTIIYFSIEVLRENIVLDPKWLIDALKSLINARPIQPKIPADNGTQADSPGDSTITQKWSDFKEKGILTLELVDAVWTKEKNPELQAHRDHILLLMEQLNIIARPMSFNENGEKVENYFLTPCMLHQRSPKEVISPEQDPRMVSTSVLCCVFAGKFLPPPIFHRLLAACVAHWPVAKKKETSEYLIFCGCCVFDLGLFHRLTLHYRNHVVFARITRMVIDEVKTPDAKLCTRVRKFITLNLSKITSYLGQNLQYELHAQFPPSQGVPEDGMVCLTPIQMWFADEGHDPDAPITREHMNHARLCVALVTVCGNALREILLTNFPVQYKDIYQAILANRVNLTRRQGRPLLNPDQIQLVFPDPQGQKTGRVDQFDLSLLYTLIRNVSTVPVPITGWGCDPQDQPRDSSLGASVERIRSYRNHISGHSPDGKISQKDFEDYWNKFDAVLRDIETVIGRQVYSPELEKQKSQVISIYETC